MSWLVHEHMAWLVPIGSGILEQQRKKQWELAETEIITLKWLKQIRFLQLGVEGACLLIFGVHTLHASYNTKLYLSS